MQTSVIVIFSRCLICVGFPVMKKRVVIIPTSHFALIVSRSESALQKTEVPTVMELGTDRERGCDLPWVNQ